MPSPPLQYSRRFAGTVLATPLFAVPVAAQQPGPRPETGLSLFAEAVGGLVLTLLIGGGFLLLAPEYTERTTDRILEEPAETFLYGLGLSIAGLVLAFVLAITVVGIVLVIPLVILAVVVGELGYLAVGRAVGDEWPIVLLVAGAVAAVASGVPYLGGLVGFVLGSTGIGAFYLDYRDGGDPGVGPDAGDSGGSTPAPVGDVAAGRRSGRVGWDAPESDRDAEATGDEDGRSVGFDYGDDEPDERGDRPR